MSENANQLVGKLASNKRAAAIQEFKSRTFDLCIIGGGIHGAWMARDAALRGLDVALLEARDYGSATSSRSSKMLHGGVRYLERGDVSLVFDALRERARCLKLAKHLCRSSEFLFPSVKGQTKPTWMIDVGLGIYDAMGRVGQDREVRKLFPPHSRLRDSSHEFQALEGMGLDFRGLLKYSDGQMNDVRLVVEVIKEARSLGAACLNYCKVTSGKRSNDLWEIQFDSLGEPHELKAKTVVSAAGPWARLLSGDLNTNSPSSTKEKHWPDIIWSRGIHLLFKQAWNLPGLIVPTGEPGRYYFIWPWTLAGVDYTLVGTTDQRTENLEDKPVPTENEVAQLLGYLKRDLPNSGLAGAVPEQSFCGVRTLASASGAGGAAASKISRKEVWVEEDGLIHLVGGKFTNARGTAEKAIDRVMKLLGGETSAQQRADIREKPLAGSRDFEPDSALENLKNSLKDSEVSDTNLGLMLGRYGAQTPEIIKEYVTKGGASLCSGTCLGAEINYTVDREQAITLEDIVYRRLNLGFEPYGLEFFEKEIKNFVLSAS